MKAIAVKAIFLIATIAIFLFFIVAIFWGWIDTTKFVTGDATCKARFISCCSALTSGTKDSCEWNDDCNQYGIENPNTHWKEICCTGELKGPKCT